MDAQNNKFMDERSQPLFNKVMDRWAKNIPPALMDNDDIKLWIGELEEHKNSIDKSSLEQEFKNFECLHANRFCKKCMPEMDQILYEAMFMIFPDYKCICCEVE